MVLSDFCSETQTLRDESTWPKQSNSAPCARVPQAAGQALLPWAEAQALFHLLGEFLLTFLTKKKKGERIFLAFELLFKS